MKIAFFTENYHKGGLDTFLINLFNAWPDSKDELTVCCNDTHPGLDTIIEKTVRTIKIKSYSRIFTSKIAQGRSNLIFSNSLPMRVFFSLTFRIMQYSVLFPWYVFTLILFFRRSDFDRLMVANGGYPASLLCRCAAIAWRFSGKNTPAIFNFHSSAVRPSWYSSAFENAIDRYVIKAVIKIVSVSKACLDTLGNRKSFLGCTKLSFVFNGIEDPALQLEPQGRQDELQASDHQYCLMLATYTSYKGHSFLFEAFKIVLKDFPDLLLKIYGFGTSIEKEQVANDVRRFGLERSVTLNNFTTTTASLIANASVLVVPSQTYESFGLTIIEAMALGTPVVTTDVGGMPEVLANSNAGFVCSKDNPRPFANAIINILGDPKLASELGRNGRKVYKQRFTAEKMAWQYYQILKNENESLYE
jgi:L-malate glycosyltransferase